VASSVEKFRLNLALGLGLAALWPVGAVISFTMDITGTDLNVFQGLDEKKNPIDPGGLTDLAAGYGGIANETVQVAYESKGGDATLKKASDIASRKGGSLGIAVRHRKIWWSYSNPRLKEFPRVSFIR
jgi:hypothetical protein